MIWVSDCVVCDGEHALGFCSGGKLWRYPLLSLVRWILRGGLDHGLGLDVIVDGGDAWLDHARSKPVQRRPVATPRSDRPWA